MSEEHQPIAAMTGGTGFLGHHLVEVLSQSGWRVRALSRTGSAPPGTDDIVCGDLADEGALTDLLAGTNILVHAAGLVKARNMGDFQRVNADATAYLLDRLKLHAPHAHTVLISSLAAREPALSAYAASKSKAEAIAIAKLPYNQLTIIRPPALYGPHDRATLAVFKAVRLPFTPAWGNGNERIALMHAEDAAISIAALAKARTSGCFSLADDRPDGYSFREILYEAARTQALTLRLVQIPTSTLVVSSYCAAGFCRLFGKATMFTPGKVREMLHPDWSVYSHELPPVIEHKRRNLETGFAETVEWYRAAGWL